MVAYTEVVKAARETIATILTIGATPRPFTLTTRGGRTASVYWSKHTTEVTINLPSYAHDQELTRSEADRIVGLVAHECAHVIYTNAAALPSMAGNTLHSMVNWIEDVRIERALLKSGKFPGLIDVLATMETQDYWHAVKARAAAGQPEVGAVRTDFGAVLALVGRTNNGYAIPGAKQALAALPAWARPVMDYAVKALPKLTSTGTAVALATDILERLRALETPMPTPSQPPQRPAPTPQQPAQPPQPPAASEEPQDGAGDEAPGAPGDSGEEPDAAQTPADAQEKGGDEPEAPRQDADGGESDDGESESAPQDGAAAPNGTGETSGDKPGQGAGGQPSGEELDAWQQVPDAKMGEDKGQAIADAVAARDGKEATYHSGQSPLLTFSGAEQIRTTPRPGYAASVRPLLPAPGPLRDQVSHLIRADERWGVERYRSTGRLDRRAMVRTAIDHTNVYTRRTFQPGVDTAVGLLLDGSGSMTNPALTDAAGEVVGTRWTMATLLALHLSEAIEAARGKVATWQFRETADNGVLLRTIKAFDEAFDADKLGLSCNDGTPLSLAMLAAADELANQPASRRILLALTDGSCDNGTQSTHLATAMCAARGIEVVGIGCGIGVGYAFPGRNVDVLDLKRLPEEGLAALVDLIQPADHGDD